MTTQDLVLICICLSPVMFSVTILILTAVAKFCELCNPSGKYFRQRQRCMKLMKRRLNKNQSPFYIKIKSILHICECKFFSQNLQQCSIEKTS